ncbi:hypothetical protein ES705_11377 [subsurface metagenome]
MWEDNSLKLAFSLYTNPKIYALLLGSGISRDAGIPTGWEIVEELIRKIAILRKTSAEPNPSQWYKKHFKQEPEYSKLLERLTATPAERASLLKAYFEPTPDEKKQRLKLPTQAHKNIAKLVKYGYIRIILTTNFERLLEKALGEEGITPVVISNDDSLEGALPFVHSKCTLIKLNGDYMDTRIKNTPKELEFYSNKLNSCLDRIFDEFGLIICGWSGEWDVALRKSILRCKNRRFSTYWLAKGDITGEAKSIIQHRQAETIHIENANKFFTELSEKIESLREFEKPHPLSCPLATITVKRYLSEEEKYHIRLFDLVNNETERVYKILASERFKTGTDNLDKEFFSKRMHEYEEVTKILASLLIPIAYFDEKEKNSYLLTKTIERIAKPIRHDGKVLLINLQSYPGLLLLYTTGIAALLKENWLHLKAIFLKPVYQEFTGSEKKPALEILNVYSVFSEAKKFIPIKNAERKYTPANEYLFELLYNFLKEYLQDKEKYGEVFDTFEYLNGLVYMHLDHLQTGMYRGSLLGCFIWKYFRERWHIKFENSPIYEFIQDGLKQGNSWKFLKAGFFNGSIENFRSCVGEYNKFLKKIGQEWS